MFSDHAWDDYCYWQTQDRKTLKRLNTLINDCNRQPFEGIGKPEALRGDLSGWWSRRINEKDRLVYRITGKDDSKQLEIAQCRFHY